MTAVERTRRPSTARRVVRADRQEAGTQAPSRRRSFPANRAALSTSHPPGSPHAERQRVQSVWQIMNNHGRDHDPHPALGRPSPRPFPDHTEEPRGTQGGQNQKYAGAAHERPEFRVKARMLVTQQEEQEGHDGQAGRNCRAGTHEDAGKNGERLHGGFFCGAGTSPLI